MIFPKEELEFILRMVGDLKFKEACMIKITRYELIGYYIYKVNRVFPHTQFLYDPQPGDTGADLNVTWIGNKEG